MIALWRALVPGIVALMLGGTAMAADAENTLYMDVPAGRVVIAMRPDLAPNHCAQIKELTRKGFYNGVVFHRVIDGFMAQTGDPTGTGTGKSSLPNIKAEFSNTPFKRGTVGMARSQDPNSAGSQFFICLGNAKFLDGQYTAFGKVIKGDDVLGKIGDMETVAGSSGEKSKPTKRITVESIKIVPADSVK